MTTAKRPMTDDEIEAVLDANWTALAERVSGRVMRTVVWSRRLEQLNGLLAAAIVLMCLQSSANMVILARLIAAAHAPV